MSVNRVLLEKIIVAQLVKKIPGLLRNSDVNYHAPKSPNFNFIAHKLLNLSNILSLLVMKPAIILLLVLKMN